MSRTGALVLPPDVVVIGVSQLDADVRRSIDATDDDCAILRPLARTPAALVDAETALLVAAFREPRRIAHVAYAWARATGAPPDLALRDVVERLEPFVLRGLIVPADSPDATAIVARYTRADRIAGWRVVRPLRTLDDTEVHQVRGPSLGALKIARRSSSAVRTSIERETAILRALTIPEVPRLLDAGTHEGQPYLVTAWRGGVSADHAASELRQGTPRSIPPPLLHLCTAILRAYAALHRAGVLHGDVHARNIVVARDRRVSLIDFDRAWRPGIDAADQPGVTRRGVIPFAEPEWARAVLEDAPPPPVTMAGEQFSLAALVYLLLTGSHHVGRSLEVDAVLRRIATPAPSSFRDLGLAPRPAVEDVLHTALHESAAQRFATVAEFADALADATPRAAPRRRLSAAVRTARERFVAGVLDRLIRRCDDVHRSSIATGDAPGCSVQYGSAGAAYALYRVALVRGDATLLAHADHLHAWTADRMHEPGAFTSAVLDIDEATVGRVSILHGEPGAHCVGALVAHARGDIPGQSQWIAAFVESCAGRHERFDLALGTAGLLSACALLRECATDAPACRSRLDRIADETADSLLALVQSTAISGGLGTVVHLGAAHGWAGLLYALLRWHEASGWQVPESARGRLHELADLAEPEGRGLRWPWGISPELIQRNMPGWCNGSAGFVHLWTLANRVTHDDRFLDYAHGAAWNAWESAGHGIDLCCGLAGRAYALLELHAHTGDAAWLRRAEDLADRAVREGAPVDHPDSLYKGELGLALLLAELEHPSEAAMPMFGREGWPPAPARGSAGAGPA